MFNEPVADPELIACRHCDLLQRLPAIAPGASARCPRCDQDLWRPRVDPLNRTLALSVAAAILYVVANTVPMLGIRVVGRAAATTVFNGAVQLWRDDQQIVAVLVLLTVVVAPALQIAFMLGVAIGARRPQPRAWVGVLLRHRVKTTTWSMLEVMLVGTLVALVKIAELASVIPGVALYALGGLIFLLAAIQANFDAREIWQRIEWAADAERKREHARDAAGMAEATS